MKLSHYKSHGDNAIDVLLLSAFKVYFMSKDCVEKESSRLLSCTNLDFRFCNMDLIG
jgi:hypothetical protein